MRSLTRIGLAFLFVAQFSSIGFAQSGIITTYVGPGLPVNGSLAAGQAIDGPSSVAQDGAGGFYVASSSQNRVYCVTADDRINLVAGNGTPGFSGDGAQATLAQLDYPVAVAVNTASDLFIVDYVNQLIIQWP